MKKLRFILIIFIFILGCDRLKNLSGDYVLDLDDKYKLWRTSPEQIMITDESNTNIVGPVIVKINMYDNCVFGLVKKPEWPQDSGSVSGYFLLNINTDILLQGLTEREWLVYLKKTGVKNYKLLRIDAFKDKILNK